MRGSADLPKIGAAPVNVLVIDELNTPYMQIAQAQEQLRRFLERQPEVLPVPTLFVASGASRITVLHDCTQSRADLLTSVKQHVTEAVLAVCYGAKDKELLQHVSQLTEEIGANDDIQDGANAEFVFPFAPPAGTTRVRFVARDAATGTLGAINVTP